MLLEVQQGACSAVPRNPVAALGDGSRFGRGSVGDRLPGGARSLLGRLRGNKNAATRSRLASPSSSYRPLSCFSDSVDTALPILLKSSSDGTKWNSGRVGGPGCTSAGKKFGKTVPPHRVPFVDWDNGKVDPVNLIRNNAETEVG